MPDIPYEVALAALVVGAAVLRFAPSTVGRSGEPPAPVEVAFLRRGAPAAARTGLVELHLLGAVEATGDGVTRRSVAPKGCSPLARALYRTLHERTHPEWLRLKPTVRQALAELSRALRRRGLLLAIWRWVLLRVLLIAVPCVATAGLVVDGATPGGAAAAGAALVLGTGLWLLPRRTVHGTVLLRRLRREAALDPPDTALAVALGGPAALRELLPRFAREGGLLTGGPEESWGDKRGRVTTLFLDNQNGGHSGF